MLQSSVASNLKGLFFQLPKVRRRQFFGLLVFMLIGAAAEMATLGAVVPLLALLADPALIHDYELIQTIFNLLGWGTRGNAVLYSCITFSIIAILAGFLRIAIAWVSFKFTYVVGKDLGAEVYRRTLYKDYHYHISRNSSEIIAGLNKVQHVVYIISHVMLCFIALVMGLAILTMLMKINALAASSVIGGFGGLYFLVTLVTRKTLKANAKVIAENENKRIQAMQEGLGGIRDVLVDANQEYYLSRFKQYDHIYRNAQASNGLISVFPRFMIESLGITLIFATAYSLSRGDGGFIAAIPILGALALGAQRLLPQMQQLYAGWSIVMGNNRLISDVLTLLTQPINDIDEKISEVKEFNDCVKLEQVGFKYSPTSAKVLADISFVIPKGGRVGFIGKTGSGKSTLTDIILGLLHPSEGQILIDGQALDARTRRSWQQQITHVPQTIYLADTSIAENIALGVPIEDIDFERIQLSAQQAQLTDVIESLPDKYNTRVGERGVQLSGGQRQRIGIARALYKRAKVIVLDEATSALDNETEALVMKALQELGKDITLLVIAHRLSTLKDCDQVVELSQGKIVNKGSYQEVIGSRL